MDRRIWTIVRQAINQAARTIDTCVYRPTYRDSQIVAMYIWAVWHDRPLAWVCDRTHYNSLFRPRRLPSVSQFRRRIKSASCQQILQHVHQQLAGVEAFESLSFIDGKPLTVGPCSKDKQAKVGRVSGGFAKGYKLHAWATDEGKIPLWSVTALNVGEPMVARELCQYLPVLCDHSLALADGNYDSAPLHNAISARGGCLLSPLKGHAEHPVTLRQMGPARREALGAWADHEDLARYVLRARDEIERIFSRLTTWGGGLGPLPAWVRTLERVTRWVGAKIILYHARLMVRTEQKG